MDPGPRVRHLQPFSRKAEYISPSDERQPGAACKYMWRAATRGLDVYKVDFTAEEEQLKKKLSFQLQHTQKKQ